MMHSIRGVIACLLLLAIASEGWVLAQSKKQKGLGSQINGRVVDSVSVRGIAFAGVQVTTREGEVLGGAICDSVGVFQVEGIPCREHGQVTIQALGYRPKTLPIDIASTKNNVFFWEM